MRILASLACVSMLALLTACPQPDGYYDAQGRFIPYDAGTPPPFAHDVTLRDHARNYPGYYTYERPGYYDYRGTYRWDDAYTGLSVPADLYPEPGSCRVWYPNRSVADQPATVYCNDIRSRIPRGAYVIYGGPAQY